MPGNSQRQGRRTSSKKTATSGSGGKNRAGLAGRGRTLPADERPWHKQYSGDEELPAKTGRKQEKERRAAAAEGRAPKAGTPGSKSTTRRVTRAVGAGGAVRATGSTARGSGAGSRGVAAAGRPRVAP